MESKKISQLATELTPDLSDLTIIGDPTTGISKKITLSQMASLFTGTVEEYANLAAFPLVGVADTIYIALDTNIIYRWDTSLSTYVVLSPNIINSLVFSDANGFDGTISLVGSVATLSITTALTLGSVPFIGASGALTQDNSNLFFDDTNNRLGIATASPTTPLDVFGSGIIGRLNATSTNNSYLGFASNGTNKWSAGNVQSDHRFRIFSEANSAELITILQTGEFGIGIANPTTKFHIDGAASALIANLDANVSVAKSVSFRSDNSSRINLEVSGTESGSNAGANFFIRRYSDAGALIDTPLTITRSTGVVSIPSLALADLTGTLAVANGGTGLTTLTAGYIPFGNGTSAFGNSANLFWDNTNSRLGISQGTPLTQLHILGVTGDNFTDGIRITRNGTPSQYGILNYAGGVYNSLAVNTLTGEPAFYWLSSTNGTSTTTRMTLNTGSYMLDVTGSGRFTSTLDATIFNSTSNEYRFSGNNALSLVTLNSQSVVKINAAGYWGTKLVGANDQGITITNTGYIGIGTDTPSDLLTLYRNANVDNKLAIYNGTSGYGCAIQLRANDDSGAGYNTIGNYTNGSGQVHWLIGSGATTNTMVFYTNNNVERMRIRGEGNVAIGDTGDANQRLRIVGSSTGTSAYGIVVASSSGASTMFVRNDGYGYLLASAWAYGSDLRMKENVSDVENGLDMVLKMKPKHFDYINGQKDNLGFIAQDIQEIIPQAVSISDETTGMLALKTDFLIPYLVKAIQEQQLQIEELKAKIK